MTDNKDEAIIATLLLKEVRRLLDEIDGNASKVLDAIRCLEKARVQLLISASILESRNASVSREQYALVREIGRVLGDA